MYPKNLGNGFLNQPSLFFFFLDRPMLGCQHFRVGSVTIGLNQSKGHINRLFVTSYIIQIRTWSVSKLCNKPVENCTQPFTQTRFYLFLLELITTKQLSQNWHCLNWCTLLFQPIQINKIFAVFLFCQFQVCCSPVFSLDFYMFFCGWLLLFLQPHGRGKRKPVSPSLIIIACLFICQDHRHYHSS